jgi:hypothetical protein
MAKYTGLMHVPNKRIKKPHGAPKRAMSAFLSFSQLMRPEIRALYPNLKNTDVSSVLAQRWHEASEEAKRPHIERELKDREKYHEDMAHWKEGESERAEADKVQQAADQAASEQAAKFQAAAHLTDVNLLPSSSLWAAMINVNGTSSFDNNTPGSPLYDEAMDGFWDTEPEEKNIGAIFDPITEREAFVSSERFTQNKTAAPLFQFELPDKEIKTESTFPSAKGQRLAKRVKDRKENLTPRCTSDVTDASDQPLTGRQLEIQQRRLQQEHQYQMYQQHLLNQKQRGANNNQGEQIKQEMRPQNFQKQDPQSKASHGISNPSSTMKGRQLPQTQVTQFNQRDSQEPQSKSRCQVKAPSGLTPNPLAQTQSLPTPQYSTYGPVSNSGGFERFFYGPGHTCQAQMQPQTCLEPLPHTSLSQGSGSFQPVQQQVQRSQHILTGGSFVEDPTAVCVDPPQEVHPKATTTPHPQPKQPFKSEEKDRFSVMQTLMAVCRASASETGDSDTLRSIDRMQMPEADVPNVQNMVPMAPLQQTFSSAPKSASLVTPREHAYIPGPLSVSQSHQDGQNQMARQYLAEKQQRPMRDMLEFQENKYNSQIPQIPEHSSSFYNTSSSSSSPFSSSSSSLGSMRACRPPP